MIMAVFQLMACDARISSRICGNSWPTLIIGIFINQRELSIKRRPHCVWLPHHNGIVGWQSWTISFGEGNIEKIFLEGTSESLPSILAVCNTYDSRKICTKNQISTVNLLPWLSKDMIPLLKLICVHEKNLILRPPPFMFSRRTFSIMTLTVSSVSAYESPRNSWSRMMAWNIY